MRLQYITFQEEMYKIHGTFSSHQDIFSTETYKTHIFFYFKLCTYFKFIFLHDCPNLLQI